MHGNGKEERWFLFNDAEVKVFDASQIAAECFGGEMTVSGITRWWSGGIFILFSLPVTVQDV